MTYVLTINDPLRFRNSRDVGCYLGLRPRRDQSGDHDPQLGITKAGNVYLRTLLTEAGNYILGPFGKDSALRRWGLNWPLEGVRTLESGPSLLLHVSWLYCCTVCG